MSRLYAPDVRRLVLLSCLTAVTAAGAPFAQTGPAEARVRRVLDAPRFRDAIDAIDRAHDRLVAETIQLTEIPAPPFKETDRGKAFLALLRETGLSNVETDAVGNVMAERKGAAGGPTVTIAAHLDTVFPEGTNVNGDAKGTPSAAPASATTRGLAVLLALAARFDTAKVQTAGDILSSPTSAKRARAPSRHEVPLHGGVQGKLDYFISVDGRASASPVAPLAATDTACVQGPGRPQLRRVRYGESHSP